MLMVPHLFLIMVVCMFICNHFQGDPDCISCLVLSCCMLNNTLNVEVYGPQFCLFLGRNFVNYACVPIGVCIWRYWGSLRILATSFFDEIAIDLLLRYHAYFTLTVVLWYNLLSGLC